jgi:hypothetical protein
MIEKEFEDEISAAGDVKDLGWLMRAMDQLKTARGVLAPSYPLAFIFFGKHSCVITP